MINIIPEYADYKFVIMSAPRKRNEIDIKVTDLLIDFSEYYINYHEDLEV
jgi:hypothetical protein